MTTTITWADLHQVIYYSFWWREHLRFTQPLWSKCMLRALGKHSLHFEENKGQHIWKVWARAKEWERKKEQGRGEREEGGGKEGENEGKRERDRERPSFTIMPQRPLNSESFTLDVIKAIPNTCPWPRSLTLWDSFKTINIHYLFSISLQEKLSMARMKGKAEPRGWLRDLSLLPHIPISAAGMHRHTLK